MFTIINTGVDKNKFVLVVGEIISFYLSRSSNNLSTYNISIISEQVLQLFDEKKVHYFFKSDGEGGCNPQRLLPLIYAADTHHTVIDIFLLCFFFFF